jgi:hypothetical protein
VTFNTDGTELLTVTDTLNAAYLTDARAQSRP